MTKITYVEALEIALSRLNAADTFVTYDYAENGERIEKAQSMQMVIDKLAALREQQIKRNSSDKKPTKMQEGNELIKAHIMEVMEIVGKPATVSELMQADEQLGDMSNQKVASLIRQLVEAGKVQRLEEKRKAYFTLVK